MIEFYEYDGDTYDLIGSLDDGEVDTGELDWIPEYVDVTDDLDITDEEAVIDRLSNEYFVGVIPDENGAELSDGGTDFSNLAEWERAYLSMYEHAIWHDDTDRALAGFSESALPEMVTERLREAILGGALFSDFDTIPSNDLADLRGEFAEMLSDDGWTLSEMTDRLQDFEPSLSDSEASTIARTETASAVNTAREEAYEDRGLGDRDEFYWSSTDDHRRTDACEWLTEETERRNGVTLETLRELIAEAPTHDDDMQDTLARPEDYLPHINCRSTYIRRPD